MVDNLDTPPTKTAAFMTPSTAMTNETTGTTWYSYYSEEKEREYYHEPTSGAVSWTAPTCSPSGNCIIQGEEEDEDSHHTPALSDLDGPDSSAWKDSQTVSTVPRRLIYLGVALFATNILLQVWTHSSLQGSYLKEGISGLSSSLTPKQCDQRCLSSVEPLPCKPVACEPVACEAVACEPVACEPAAACEPVACTPDDAAGCPDCPEPPSCDPIVEYKCDETATAASSSDHDLARNDVATLEHLQRVLQDNLKAIDLARQHVQDALPDENVGPRPSFRQEILPKVCRIPLAKRMVPECREEGIQN